MSILDEAKTLAETMVRDRRFFHVNAEVHNELPKTTAYVMARLKEMGYEPKEICRSGVVAVAGDKPGKTFLLRADMDALPIVEQSGLAFSSQTENMHACGHDMHTAMLLGAAQLIKNHEDELCGQIKLMFQPAEETLWGAKAMIEAGALDSPKVDAAMMLHVLPGTHTPTGCVAVYEDGAASAASDWFKIIVTGKGSHGAKPNEGVDPINVLVHIYLSLQTINAREIAPDEPLALTVGQIQAGTARNVIPESAFMYGTLRTFSERTRKFVVDRIFEISGGVASSLRATATVEHASGCPSVIVDKEVNDDVIRYLADLLGADKVVDMKSATGSPKSSGSEDFAFISGLVPSTRLSILAGSVEEGHGFGSHHPRTSFNEDALTVGAAVYANTAMRWLIEHS